MAHNVNCVVESRRILKVAGSYEHGKSGDIWDMVQDRCVATTDH